MDSLTTTEQQVLAYLHEFVHYADFFCTTLIAAFPSAPAGIPPLEQLALVAPRGQVQTLQYAFHGLGCTFQQEGMILSLDFDSLGQWSGFAPWHISSFLSTNHPTLGLSSEDLAQVFDTLVAKQWLYQVERAFDQEFYYLTPPY
ncbi:DUF6896 domain-containing protein [Hymenobacter crusticola]|uniref:DUF6896 domain-containing protein n=1 Tax=Hymenobacter crusticola TaxID=1770526 RepID=A0A243W4S1_9BACT|nr:hypothetical protein [Hymenobacter crusticola]OUJ66324.1 hypothetical protein BXP70_29060 [Hymenobacter crusticola]